MKTNNNTAAQIAVFAPEANPKPGPTAKEKYRDMLKYHDRHFPERLDHRYDMTMPELCALYEVFTSRRDVMEVIACAYGYGLAKGYRAARAEQKRQRRRNPARITAATKAEG